MAVQPEPTPEVSETHIRKIRRARAEVIAAQGIDLLNTDIWRGSRDCDLPPTLKYFLWMVTHGTYILGSSWLTLNTLDHQEKAMCRVCKVIESLEHIIFECLASGQRTIWEGTKHVWVEHSKTWHQLNVSLITTSPIGEVGDRGGKMRSSKKSVGD